MDTSPPPSPTTSPPSTPPKSEGPFTQIFAGVAVGVLWSVIGAVVIGLLTGGLHLIAIVVFLAVYVTGAVAILRSRLEGRGKFVIGMGLVLGVDILLYWMG